MKFSLPAVFAIMTMTATTGSAAVLLDDRSVLATATERQPAAGQQAAPDDRSEGVQVRRGGKPGFLQVDDEQEQQQHGRMVKAKKSKKSGRRTKNTKKEQHNIFDGRGSGDDCDIEDFISETTYDNGGTCDMMFKVKIDCNDSRDLCTFEEESMEDCSESKSAHDTCFPFDPKEWLRYNGRRDQCVLGRKKGLRLKDQSDTQGCSAKYNVKVVMEADDTSTLYLYFSDNDGKSFYNLDDPRVATKDLADRGRMLQSCTGCKARGQPCNFTYQCQAGLNCNVITRLCCAGSWYNPACIIWPT
mmetsp:Transcript_31711/g.71735  ORF Transcript_31711/g.71735 Transcript_31711/m.71735 type:complete len:301 (+) Transcript_31711:266-1168(+)